MKHKTVFYIKTGLSCPVHSFHHQTDSKEIWALSNSASEKEKTERNTWRNIRGPAAVGERFFHEKMGYSIAHRFFQMSPEGDPDDKTICDKLCSVLRNSPDFKYTVLYLDTPDLKHHSNLPDRRRGSSVNMHLHGNNTTQATTTFPLEEMDDQCQIEINSLLEDFTSTESGRMFLAVAWTRKHESTTFKMHPEVCSWDVTKGTNS